MQILGIVKKDFATKERACFQDGLAGDVRHEVFEIKRRQLMHNVKKLARDPTLDFSKSHSTGSLPQVPQVSGIPTQTSAATNKFLADVLAKEAKSMEKMRARAKGDVQSIVLKEMEVKKTIEAAKEREEAHEKRRRELQKARDKVLEEQRKELEKKYKRAVETRRRAVEAVEEHANELAEELKKKDERVENLLAEREEGWEQNRVDKQAAREAKYREISKHEGTRRRRCENLYNSILTRTAKSEGCLAEHLAKQQAVMAAKSDRTDAVIATSRAFHEKKHAEKEQMYMKRLVEHSKEEDNRLQAYDGTIIK
jgi:hypothetical protein